MTTVDRPLLRERPGLAAPGPWSFPASDVLVLDNGMEVRLHHLPGQHVISVGLSLDIPLTAEPRDREGVAVLTADALNQGTATHPGVTYLDAVERCGAALEASVTYSATQVYLDVPGSHLAEALPLLAEAVREPQLADADVERERALRLAQLEQQRANGAARADHEMRSALLGATFRAARLRTGEADTLAAVTGDDVRGFHARHYGPAGAALVVAGDLGDGVRGLIEGAFGGWSNPEQAAVDHEHPAPRERALILADRPGAVQADVRIGRFTIDRRDARWPSYQLAVHALGGAFLSRLNAVLREEKGYTYGVHLTNAPMRAGGYSTVVGSFRNDVVADAVALVPGLLDVASAPLTADEVDNARRYLAGVQPLQYATASGVCNGVLALLGAGQDPAFVDRLRAAWNDVTPESATAAASELLPPDDLTIVVVGDAAVLADGLRGAGFDVTITSDADAAG